MATRRQVSTFIWRKVSILMTHKHIMHAALRYFTQYIKHTIVVYLSLKLMFYSRYKKTKTIKSESMRNTLKLVTLKQKLQTL